MRSEKVALNSVWGMAYKLLTIVLGFLGRTFFIKYLGAEYLGISGLFSSVLTILSLSELGLSTAITFHLYKVLAQDDREAIAAIIHFYRSFYKLVALFIATVGLLILPFLKYIVKDSAFSITYIGIVYLFYLFKTVCSYFYSYSFTLALADQKAYILTRIDIVMHMVISLVNIASLILFRNYLVYLGVEILLALFSNALKFRRIKKMYPYISSKAIISKERKTAIMTDVKNIFAGKIATVVVTSTDNVLISTLISISAVGLYSNYAMIISYVQAFLAQITQALQASLGNLLATESREYAYTTLKRTTMILHFLASFCTVCLYVMLTPFIRLWLGAAYTLNQAIVFWCVANFYLQIIKCPLWVSLSGVGYFAQDKNIAIYGAVSNLVVSVVAAKLWGLSGIFFGTVFSQSTQWIFKAKLFIEQYLHRSVKAYLGLSLGLMLLTAATAMGTAQLVDMLCIRNPMQDLFLRMAACTLIPNSVNLLLFWRTDAFAYLLNFAKRLVHRRNKTK